MFYVKVKDDVKIAVYDLNPTAEKTIFMVHGWPLAGRIFEYQKRVLAEHGFRVVTIDLRGFGKSDAPFGGYDFDRLADDIFQVVMTMKLTNFVFAGFSMGGAICARYMRRFRGHGVEKLILMGAAVPKFTRDKTFPYGVTKQSVDALIEQAKKDCAKLSHDFSRKLLATPNSEEIKNWFALIGNEASGIATVSTMRSLRDEDGREDLEYIKVPTGIFHGKKDEVVPYELALIQKRGIPQARLFTFENSGHGVFYDELQLFNRTLLDYL